MELIEGLVLPKESYLSLIELIQQMLRVSSVNIKYFNLIVHS